MANECCRVVHLASRAGGKLMITPTKRTDETRMSCNGHATSRRAMPPARQHRVMMTDCRGTRGATGSDHRLAAPLFRSFKYRHCRRRTYLQRALYRLFKKWLEQSVSKRVARRCLFCRNATSPFVRVRCCALSGP